MWSGWRPGFLKGFRVSLKFLIREFSAKLVSCSQPGYSKESVINTHDMLESNDGRGPENPLAHGTGLYQLRWLEMRHLELNCNVLNYNPSILHKPWFSNSRAPFFALFSLVWLGNQNSPQNGLSGQAQLRDKMKYSKKYTSKRTLFTPWDHIY